MDLLNDVKFEKSDTEECHNNDAASGIPYKRKMFGQQKTCMYLFVTHILLLSIFLFKLYFMLQYRRLQSTIPLIHNTKIRVEVSKMFLISMSNLYPYINFSQFFRIEFSLADKTLDCITNCFWQCSSCYQCNEKY